MGNCISSPEPETKPGHILAENDAAVFGVCGLANLGKSGWMNVALQCLFHCPPLTEYFLSENWSREMNESNPLGSGGPVVLAYADLVQKAWSGTYSSLFPREFKEAVNKIAARFDDHEHDAHEFLACLLDVLHEDLNRIRHKPDYYQTDSNGLPDEEVALRAWSRHKKRNDSVIVDLFHGLIKARVICSDCAKITVRFDPFAVLSLPLPIEEQDVELNNCVHFFTEEQELGKEDPIYCGNCKKHCEATKKLDIWTAPRILIINLKRFCYKGGQWSKNKSLVNFPIRGFDMGPHTLSQTSGDSILYDLIGVINHVSYPSHGHYYAYCLNKSNHQWYSFDDDRVTPCFEASILVILSFSNSVSKRNKANCLQTEHAYLLVYKRREEMDSNL